MSWPWSSKPKLLETAKFSIIDHVNIIPDELGRGSYGTVYAAEYNGKPCVAKEMHPCFNQQGHQNTSAPIEAFFKEINTLSSLRHPSIVQFLGVYFRDKSSPPILVMERMWKNLYDVLDQHPNQLPLLIKTHILYDVACGLQYLHGQKKPVVHRDLSASNILLTENLVAKIADLGQAKALEKIAEQRLSTAPGNLAHMAPETLKHQPTYDYKLDIFSFGCTVIHLVTEKFPSPTAQFVESEGNSDSYVLVSEVNRRKQLIDLMGSIDKLLQQIACNCLHNTPSSRPPAPEICEELEQYIKNLEKESAREAKRCKQDKLSLLWSLQKTVDQLESKEKIIKDINLEKNQKEDSLAKREEYIAALEAELQDKKTELDQIKTNYFSVVQKKESLKTALAKQEEINKQLTATYKTQADRLREDVKIKQDEIKEAGTKLSDLQEEVRSLEIKLKDESLNLSLEKHKVTELNDQLQEISKKADDYKKELAEANENLAKQESKYRTESEKRLEAVADECAEKEGIITQLRKKLEEKECSLNKMVESLTVNEDYRLKYTDLHQKYEELKQQNKKRQQREIHQPQQVVKKVTDPGTKLHKHLLELQHINETKHSQLEQQQLEYTSTFRLQDAKISGVQAQMTDLKKKSVIQKQQLEEKSYRLSTLESSLNEMQETLYSREEKLKISEEECGTLNKSLENNKKLHRVLQTDLKSKEESLKRKDEELNLVKKEQQDKLNQLHVEYKRQIHDLTKDVEMYKSQKVGQGEAGKLLEEEARYKFDLMKGTEENKKRLENELKNAIKSQKMLKKQIKGQENTIKEKTKYIEQLEKKTLNESVSQYCFNVHWYPYMSLPVNRIRSSAVIMKDKVFITGGYQQISPHDEDIDYYLKSVEGSDKVFCFHTRECRCDSLASPVVLGGVASVNGQCVLVSGAEGNTLTGNVYVLCEEGSDEQWKKFSEPVPTPRILPCVCCYGERWLIVCGGYICKEGSNLLEAVNVVEILDTTKGQWYTLMEEHCLKAFKVLCCAVVDEDVYVVGDQIFKCNANKLISIITATKKSDIPLWFEIEIQVEGILHPFSVVDVNQQPMIVASISGSEDDVTCVLMKDTTDTWRKMSEAVECQHCSAVVVTPTLELLLFGGSEKVSVDMSTDVSQKGTLIPTLMLHGNLPIQEMNAVSFLRKDNLSLQDNVSNDPPIVKTVTQPPAVSFIGTIDSQQFDHKGGMFQSPVHKVSIVVPPNAIDDGEKVTVHMGATTSGPFDLPEDCKLRSAVVWLGSGSDVVLKRSIAVVVPHSAVFTSPQHHSMMRFLTCENCEGPRYKFNYCQNHFDVDEEQGWIEISKFAMVTIATSPEYTLDDEGIQCNSEEEYGSDDEFYEAPEDVESLLTPQSVLPSLSNHRLHQLRNSPKGKRLRMPSARYHAKLFWPSGQLPNSFRVDVYYLQDLPTELHKVNTLYRQAYYEDNGSYPEMIQTEFMLDGDGTELKCVLPCSGSNECDCLSGWSVTQMNDINEVYLGKDSRKYKIDPMRISFKFGCPHPNANLRCCFEFKGANRIMNGPITQIPTCLEKRYQPPNLNPFIIQQIIYCDDTAVEELGSCKMNTQAEESPVADSHQVKSLL